MKNTVKKNLIDLPTIWCILNYAKISWFEIPPPIDKNVAEKCNDKQWEKHKRKDNWTPVKICTNKCFYIYVINNHPNFKTDVFIW